MTTPTDDTNDGVDIEYESRWSGEDLRAARDKLGLNEIEFATAFGMPNTRNLRRWERGQQEIPWYVETLVELAVDCECARKKIGIDKIADLRKRRPTPTQ